MLAKLDSAPSFTPAATIDPAVRVGHVHLKVADLDRSLAFYSGVLGFQLRGRFGDEAAFLAAGGYHHHLAINTWESRNGSPPPAGSTGLYHVAFLYPTEASLAAALRSVRAAGIPVDGAREHGVSKAIYVRDPDGNGVELTWDRPETEWPHHPDGSLKIVNDPLDLEALTAS
jgi:catechol 2,3-dioxygenase